MFGKWFRLVMLQTAFCAGIEDDSERENWIVRLAKDQADYIRDEVATLRLEQVAGTMEPGMAALMTPKEQASLEVWAENCVNPPSRSKLRKYARRERKKLRKGIA